MKIKSLCLAFICLVCANKSVIAASGSGEGTPIPASSNFSSNGANPETDIEAVWPNRPLDYFQQKKELFDSLATAAETKSEVAARLLASTRLALEKSCPEDLAIRLACFRAKQEIVDKFAGTVWLEHDYSNACLIASSFHEAHAAIIPNYQPKPAFMNVAPPIMPKLDTNIPGIHSGAGIASGMDPKDIADPVARAAYEKAIQDNRMVGVQNQFQKYIVIVADNLKRNLYRYCADWFKQDPTAKKYRDDIGKIAGLSPAETAQLGFDF